jgi:RNA polymerase sigma-70 factor (ECF subfamily)
VAYGSAGTPTPRSLPTPVERWTRRGSGALTISSVLGNELVAIAQTELEKLPERQRMVVTLRDMLGFDSGEVCELLEISVANQRVLLHRGRAAARQVLEDYLREPA